MASGSELSLSPGTALGLRQPGPGNSSSRASYRIGLSSDHMVSNFLHLPNTSVFTASQVLYKENTSPINLLHANLHPSL